MCIVPYDKLKRAMLPPELIIDNYIQNYRDVSSEEYLTEYVNRSTLFLNLSGGIPYQHTPKRQQCCAECDCRSEKYEFDFKRLGTQSSLYAKRNLSLQKVQLTKGVIATCIPRQLDGMYIARTLQLLNQHNLNDLKKIDSIQLPKFDRNNLSPEREIKYILKSAKCRKNVLFFCEDFIYSTDSYPLSDIVCTLEKYLNDCLSALFMFREDLVPDKDTYLGIIVQGHMCFAIWEKHGIHFKDSIPLADSPVFSELYSMVNEYYKPILQFR